ncbi:MAG: hypothetical protein HGB05_15445 [Chloroflexi bacterium]|nr:hypothetical protein [Chloroflexota bacterium]
MWPEGALNYDPRQRNSDVFQRLAKENNVYLVIGFAQRFDLGLYFWDHGINIEINDPT